MQNCTTPRSSHTRATPQGEAYQQLMRPGRVNAFAYVLSSSSSPTTRCAPSFLHPANPHISTSHSVTRIYQVLCCMYRHMKSEANHDASSHMLQPGWLAALGPPLAGKHTTSTTAPMHMPGGQVTVPSHLLTLAIPHVMSNAVSACAVCLLLIYKLVAATLYSLSQHQHQHATYVPAHTCTAASAVHCCGSGPALLNPSPQPHIHLPGFFATMTWYSSTPLSRPPCTTAFC
jgi:hypothetical protein